MDPTKYENDLRDELSSKAFALELYKEIAKEFDLNYEICENFSFPAMKVNNSANNYDLTLSICAKNKIDITYDMAIKTNTRRVYNFAVEINDNYLESIRKIMDVLPYMSEGIAWDPGLFKQIPIKSAWKEKLLKLLIAYDKIINNTLVYVVAVVAVAIIGLASGYMLNTILSR